MTKQLISKCLNHAHKSVFVLSLCALKLGVSLKEKHFFQTGFPEMHVLHKQESNFIPESLVSVVLLQYRYE